MRIKFLSVIVSFLLVSFAMSSCLGDDDPIEYSPNALLQAFELDKVLGVNYQFTIDQLTGEIYNQDSLPVGSDTIIDRILIKTMTVTGFVTIRNSANTEDSIFNIADSVNLVGTVEKPFRFKVWAPDMEHTREYALSVRVHQQQPDSLNWGKGPAGTNFAPQIKGKQKSIIFNNQIYVYGASSSSVYYTTLSNGQLGTDGTWNSSTINGLPSTNITSIVNFNSTLYATTAADKKVYSSNDVITWEIFWNDAFFCPVTSICCCTEHIFIIQSLDSCQTISDWSNQNYCVVSKRWRFFPFYTRIQISHRFK